MYIQKAVKQGGRTGYSGGQPDSSIFWKQSFSEGGGPGSLGWSVTTCLKEMKERNATYGPQQCHCKYVP